MRRMMLNMDPPEHSRLRRLLARSFTPRAVAALEGRIAGHARGIVDRMLAGPAHVRLRQGRRRRPAAARPGRRARRSARGPVADVRLVEPGDRLPGPGLRRRRRFSTPRAAATWRVRLWRVRPAPGRGRADARPAQPRRHARPLPLRASARRGQAGRPRCRRHVDTSGPARRRRRPGLSRVEFENLFWLFAVAGNETLRNGLPGAHDRAAGASRGAAAAARRPVAAAGRGRGDAALVDAGDDVPPHRDRATPLGGQPVSRPATRSSSPSSSANRDRAVFPDPDDFDIRRDARTRTWRSATGRTSASAHTWRERR